MGARIEIIFYSSSSSSSSKKSSYSSPCITGYRPLDSRDRIGFPVYEHGFPADVDEGWRFFKYPHDSITTEVKRLQQKIEWAEQDRQAKAMNQKIMEQ